MKKTIAILIAAAFIASASYATLRAQAPTKSVTQGVYTQDQAKRGEALYKDNCAACHGDDLAGSGPMPPLAGPDFTANWNNKMVSDLFDKIHSSMPASAPGSLTEQQTSDIIAYMLSVGKYPAGADELAAKMDALTVIKIEPSAGGATGTTGSPAAPAAPAAPGAAK